MVDFCGKNRKKKLKRRWYGLFSS